MTIPPSGRARPRVIVAAPNHWTSVLQVGTHHIARAFVAEGWDVAYLSDPISPFHLATSARPETRQRFRLYLRGGQQAMGGRLFAYVPGTILSPRGPRIAGMANLARGWLSRTLPGLTSILARRGFGSVDLVWIDSVIWEPLLDATPAARSVLRIADRASGFTRHGPELAGMEERLAARVDVVVYSAATLENHVRSLGPKTMRHLPNGVDIDRFRTPTPAPPEYERVPKPRAVYVGAMAEWFDFRLVADLAAALPSVSFVLIGPEELARRRLPRRSNLFLLGRQPPRRVPALLAHAHVGLIPFDVAGYRDLVAAVHPLKLYEYLAVGLPVVAARWPELEELASPARLYANPTEAVKLIVEAINSEADRRALASWVEGASWAARLRAVLPLLMAAA